MRAFSLLLLAALAVATGCKKTEAPLPGTPDIAPVPDRDRFQGVWKIEAAETGDPGKDLAGQDRLRFQVQGDRVAFGETYAAAWDEAATPRTLTLTPLLPNGTPDPVPDGKQVWIYRFEGERLIVAFSPPGEPAPKGFVARLPGANGSPGVIVLRMSRTTEPSVPPNK